MELPSSSSSSFGQRMNGMVALTLLSESEWNGLRLLLFSENEWDGDPPVPPLSERKWNGPPPHPPRELNGLLLLFSQEQEYHSIHSLK